MSQIKIIETERLSIRPTIEEDADFILELFNTPKWKEHIGERNLNTSEDAARYIREKMMPQFETHGYSNNTLIRKTDQVKVGTCGLYDREGLEGVDIGFALLPAYEKMGYAYEASSKIMTEALETFKIKKISAITTEANIDSQRLIEKLGLKYIKMIFLPNDEEELMLYELDVK